MSEAKRYRVRQTERGDGFAVVEPDGVRVMATTLEPWQAERVARLLNAEDAVRAALEEASRFVAAVIATEDEPQPGDMATLDEIASALSALDAEAVRP